MDKRGNKGREVEQRDVAERVATRALPVSPGRFALWLFLSTEVVLFGALFSTYWVLRSSSPAWPTFAEAPLERGLGWLNTAVMVASSLVVVIAAGAARRKHTFSARVWLALTIVLGAVFLGVKSYEYTRKSSWGWYPHPGRRQVFDRADAHYLSALGAEFRRRMENDATGRIEPAARVSDGPVVAEPTYGEAGAQRSGDSAAPGTIGRTDPVSIAHRGLVLWTERHLATSTDRVACRRSLTMAAQFVFPRLAERNNMIKWLRAEDADLKRESAWLEEQERRIAVELEAATRLANEIRGDPEARQQRDEVRQRIQTLMATQSEMRQRSLALEDRRAFRRWIEPHDQGINRELGWGLPVVQPGGDRWMNAYYLLTGFHALHVAGGLLALLGCAVVLGRDFGRAALANTAIYWQFIDGVWLVIFGVFYLV